MDSKTSDEKLREEFEAWFEPNPRNRKSVRSWRCGDAYESGWFYLNGCWQGFRAASSARSEEMAALRAIVCKLVKARNRAPDVVAFSDMVDEFIEDAAALTPTEKPE